MKLITYSIFRALCAIAVGALLVKYREDMVEWMTIAIGALFFLSGAIAMIASMSKKKVTGNKAAETTDADSTELVYDETNANMNYGEEETATQRNGWGWGSFVGMGSMILGIILILMPKTFVEFLVYIISGFPHHRCHTAVCHPWRGTQERLCRLRLLDYACPALHRGMHSLVQTHSLCLCTTVLHRLVPHMLRHSRMHKCTQGTQQPQEIRERTKLLQPQPKARLLQR